MYETWFRREDIRNMHVRSMWKNENISVVNKTKRIAQVFPTFLCFHILSWNVCIFAFVCGNFSLVFSRFVGKWIRIITPFLFYSLWKESWFISLLYLFMHSCLCWCFFYAYLLHTFTILIKMDEHLQSGVCYLLCLQTLYSNNNWCRYFC